MARKKITGDELNARAKAHGYQRGIRRDEDSRRDRNKHLDDTKKDQDTALDRYMLSPAFSRFSNARSMADFYGDLPIDGSEFLKTCWCIILYHFMAHNAVTKITKK
jgi:hypothetical protein